jgi:hypothetical protein
MPEKKPVIDPKTELPFPHDMQLSMSHWQRLPRPSGWDKKTWLMTVLVTIVFLFLAFYAWIAFSVIFLSTPEHRYILQTLPPISPTPTM